MAEHSSGCPLRSLRAPDYAVSRINLLSFPKYIKRRDKIVLLSQVALSLGRPLVPNLTKLMVCPSSLFFGILASSPVIVNLLDSIAAKGSLPSSVCYSEDGKQNHHSSSSVGSSPYPCRASIQLRGFPGAYSTRRVTNLSSKSLLYKLHELPRTICF
jgi:hypothetical protein